MNALLPNSCPLAREGLRSEASPVESRQATQTTDWLDLSVVAYLLLPLLLFLSGWLKAWVSIVSISCLALSLAMLTRSRICKVQPPAPFNVLLLCITTAAAWAYLGGIGHFRYANLDWVVRDAVLRDLVVSQWPVGYGLHQGQETLMRSTIAYFLPSAVLGKIVGLHAVQPVLFIWTVLGISLFFFQTVTLLPNVKRAIVALLVIITFSGMDVIGSLLRGGQHFVSSWRIDSHLEWWAYPDYQYSAMTTQLFWVPNHAIGGWLFVGMLLRGKQITYGLIPILLVALVLWSPLTSIGTIPFVLWRYSNYLGSWHSLLRTYWLSLIGALLVAFPVAGYVTLDPAKIPKGLMPLTPISLANLMEFYFLEVGIVGWLVFYLRPYTPVLVALIMLFILPFTQFGAANDFVMRGSIPSLAVLVITVSRVLTTTATSTRERVIGYAVMLFLLIGAVTPMEEIARSFLQPRWESRNAVNLVGAMCGGYWPHYIAKLDYSPMRYLLRTPHVLPPGPKSPEFCDALPELP